VIPHSCGYAKNWILHEIEAHKPAEVKFSRVDYAKFHGGFCENGWNTSKIVFIHWYWLQRLVQGNEDCQDNWSMSELMHAIVLLAHFHSLASFVFGCGVTSETDHPDGHVYSTTTAMSNDQNDVNNDNDANTAVNGHPAAAAEVLAIISVLHSQRCATENWKQNCLPLRKYHQRDHGCKSKWTLTSSFHHRHRHHQNEWLTYWILWFDIPLSALQVILVMILFRRSFVHQSVTPSLCPL